MNKVQEEGIDAINPSLATYLEYKLMIPFCVDFTVSLS